jgi:hypothetical protein
MVQLSRERRHFVDEPAGGHVEVREQALSIEVGHLTRMRPVRRCQTQPGEQEDGGKGVGAHCHFCVPSPKIDRSSNFLPVRRYRACPPMTGLSPDDKLSPTLGLGPIEAQNFNVTPNVVRQKLKSGSGKSSNPTRSIRLSKVTSPVRNRRKSARMPKFGLGST